MADAFLASPHRHLDSYNGMVWPADNVTALLSIMLHDRLYGTDHGRAYQEWKRWTLDHLHPETGLMGGRLDSNTRALIEPARGSGNSWITTLLAEIDPEFAKDLYSRYRKHFAIERLDFLMFREWPEGVARGEDIDSGPIIWGAGVTATGVGLAAARANGDAEMASHIHALSELIGWPTTSGDQTRYVFGRLPVGDAFLAFGKSTRASIAPKESRIGRVSRDARSPDPGAAGGWSSSAEKTAGTQLASTCAVAHWRPVDRTGRGPLSKD